MKKFLALLVILFATASPLLAFAQGERSAGTAGCTDRTATNYRESATIDDGSCVDGEVKANIERIQAENTQRTQSQQTSGFVALAPIPGLTQGVTANEAGLANFFNNLYKYLIGMAAVLAVIMIIWGGLQYATQDIPGAKQEGKDRILQAILGLGLVLSPVLVFSIINPSILNLSINLKPLDTASSFPTGTGSGTQPIPRADEPSGCTTVTGSLFKKATCPTRQAAEKFASLCTTGTGSVSPCQAENATGCTDTSYFATCDTTSGSIAGPYVFLDTSHYLNPVQIFSNYIPLASSATNQNNGVLAVQFATTCTRDGGVTCVAGNGVTGGLVSTSCTYTTSQSTSQTNKCYSAILSCKSSSWATNLNIGVGTSWLYVCSGSPSWTPIP